MSTRIRWSNALLILVVISGCSGIKSGLKADYVVESDLDHGVVVGSAGSNRPLPTNKFQEWSIYLFRSKSNQEVRGSVQSARFHDLPLNPIPGCAEDGLPDECGLLFAITLPVGEYEFFAVIPAADSRSAADTLSFDDPWDTSLHEYKFTVTSGQVSYLGNLLSRICSRTNSYFPLARSALGDVADMYSRDVPLLREKFPQLEAVPFANETMSGEPWLWVFKQPKENPITMDSLWECTPQRD